MGRKLLSRYIPSFPHELVFETPTSIYTFFTSQCLYEYSSQLTSLEFGTVFLSGVSSSRSPIFDIREPPRMDIGLTGYDFISILLLNCLNVTELWFPVFLARPTRINLTLLELIPNSDPVIYPISHVELCTYRQSVQSQLLGSEWSILESHFDAICGPYSRFGKFECIDNLRERLD